MTALLWSPVVVASIVGVALGVWTARGGHVLIMKTPSMGTTVPVGSLVLATPLSADAHLQPGTVVVARVPGFGLITHRIQRVLPGGRLRTRGDVNAADDPWTLTRANVVGTAAAIVPGAGWLVEALPWIVLSLGLGLGIAHLAPSSARDGLRALGVGGAICLPLCLLRPLARISVVATAATGHVARARVVDAGLLPLKVTLGHAHTVLTSGQAATLTSGSVGNASEVHLHSAVALGALGWAILAACVLAPLPISAVLSHRRATAPPG